MREIGKSNWNLQDSALLILATGKLYCIELYCTVSSCIALDSIVMWLFACWISLVLAVVIITEIVCGKFTLQHDAVSYRALLFNFTSYPYYTAPHCTMQLNGKGWCVSWSTARDSRRLNAVCGRSGIRIHSPEWYPCKYRGARYVPHLYLKWIWLSFLFARYYYQRWRINIHTLPLLLN